MYDREVIPCLTPQCNLAQLCFPRHNPDEQAACLSYVWWKTVTQVSILLSISDPRMITNYITG